MPGLVNLHRLKAAEWCAGGGGGPRGCGGRLDQLEALMPGLVNLHRLKAADWCAGRGGGGPNSVVHPPI